MPKIKGQRVTTDDVERILAKAKKDRTDLTGRHDVTAAEIIKGLTPKSDRKKEK